MPTVDAGLTPKPWKNRAAIYPEYVFAMAAPIVETRAIVVPIIKMSRRPYMSLKELHIRGPTERPNAGTATVQLTWE